MGGPDRPVRGTARVGCSGWSYRDWRGIVYPADLPASGWFGHYAGLFDTVELNTTFYRLPTPEAVEGWAAKAPPGFVFALKVGQFGSHRKKLRDAETWLPNHLDRAQRLGPTLGPNVLQLPPRWKRNVARLDEFLALAPRSMRWTVELRDPSWVHDDVFDVLRRHGAALCIHDLIEAHPLEVTTDWTYLRFHGPDALQHRYLGEYGSRRLAPIAAWLDELLADGKDVYCYFNNDFEGFAVRDALALRAALDREWAPS